MNLGLPLLGGVLIGLAAFLLHMGIGRVAGISGILGHLLPAVRRESPWRWMFLLGLLMGGAVMVGLRSNSFALPPHHPSILRVAFAGLLVGFGTRLGGGCTSGHGVCGISRMAPRSLLATLVFMAAGVAVVARLPLGG